jgi:hypothetical protein
MKLFVDTFAEIYDLLKPWIHESYWDFSTITPETGSIYVIGRQQLLNNKQKIMDMAKSDLYTIIFNNSAEGSWPLETQIKYYGIEPLVSSKKILLIGGAQVDSKFACLTHEHFLSHILDYQENIEAQSSTDKIFEKTEKPFKFLFLNGRARPHRKYLYEKFKRIDILKHAIWTMLDSNPLNVGFFDIKDGETNLMHIPSPIKKLPECYEVDRYRDTLFKEEDAKAPNIKQDLFNSEWGEIYLEPAPYIDTYFSLITETVCYESSFSFRTEKTAKPLAMGHPFIVASTPGFYRDLHNLGFKTFGHVIDESFDLIDNAQDRLDRITEIVVDLCRQDLSSFLGECYNTCKYNQQRLAELQSIERQKFPQRFFDFLNQYSHKQSGLQ